MSTLTSTYSAFAPVAADAPSAPRDLAARIRAWFARPSKDPIEALIEANGGVLSDTLEREISRRLHG